MKRVLSLIVALCMVTVAFAADGIKSGLKEGKSIGAFYVTKLSGAKDDGVKVGQNLCYRCKNGLRPQVMVFTRSTDKKVVDLVAKLDKALLKNKSKQLRAFVNVLGESKSDAKKASSKLAEGSKATSVPFVVPNEYENGPGNYGLNKDADVTILLANKGKVKVNIAVKAAKELDVDKFVKSLNKILD